MGKPMPAILFVCTGNLYRSPLAEAFFRGRLRAHQTGNWVVASAGTWTTPGQPSPSIVVRAAEKFGASLENHRAQLVSADLLSRFDLVLVMERGQKEALDYEFPSASHKIHLLSQAVDHMDYDIADPLTSGQQIYSLADDLHKLIGRGYVAICGLALELSRHSDRK